MADSIDSHMEAEVMSDATGGTRASKWTAAVFFMAIVAGLFWVVTGQQRVTATAAPQNENNADNKEDADKKGNKLDIRKLTPVQAFMRAKRNDNSTILEGLMTNQFDQIVDAAEHLHLMSTATEWHVIQGPVYKQHSTEFRQTVERLKTEAKKKNLDGATLAYMHMTMTCVNCHKFVRGTQLADATIPDTDSAAVASLGPTGRP